MKAKLLALIVLAAFVLPFAADAATRVRGYTTKSGSYVAPHYRSSSDGARYNNWSTKGNVNPYTGKRGTRSAW